MRKQFFIPVLSFLVLCLTSAQALNIKEETSEDHLVIVWTSDDPYTAERMVLMYAHTSKTAGWFDEVTLIIWGPSAKMVAENIKMQEKLKAMQEDGVEIRACIVCANMYEVTEELNALGFDVRGMGKPLTDYLKGGAKVLTF
ncbi:MAG: DsrE family protein [Bacteroidales bacterium]|nr:DsrE family protein [Bacteroidales bacterium]